LGLDRERDLNMQRLWNVKYYISASELKPEGLEKIYDDRVKIYRDNLSMPRFYMVYGIKNAASEEEVFGYIRNGKLGRNEAVTSNGKITGLYGVKSKNDIKPALYTPNKIELAVSTEKDGLLVISNFYDDNWAAEVDGKPAKTYCVNYCMTGLLVPAGSHNVVMKYSINNMPLYAAGTSVSLLIYLFLMAFEYMKKKKKQGLA
jgi:uncharacterized membrane protein YfhO